MADCFEEYIDRWIFIAEKRKQYCVDCNRRKGMKNGKLRFCYDIGEAPCRACEINDMLNDVEDFPATDVSPIVRCKDCQNSYEWVNVDGDNYRYCGYLRDRWNRDYDRMVDDDDFCKWGRKMDKEDADGKTAD